MLFEAISKLPTPILWFSGAAASVGFVLLLKETAGGPNYRGPQNAEDKVVVITGANNGIGKETAWELARRGARVYMACRDMAKCELARKEIVLDTKNKYIYCRPCDLASLESVKKFVETFKKEEKKLNILINNAGVMELPKNSKTREGFEMQLGVNHMGHFLLTNLLLDVIKTSTPSRIINVTCIVHKKGKINKQDLNSDQSYNPREAYAQSKLANVLFTTELAKKLQGTNVTVNTIHPGTVDTDITRHTGFYKSRMASALVYPLMWPFIQSPKQGAQAIIYLALDEKVKDTTGKYFIKYDTFTICEQGRDDNLATWLWKVSEKWTRFPIS